VSMCHGFDVDVIPSHTRHPPKRVWEGHGENIRRPVLTRTRDPSRVTIPVSITGKHPLAWDTTATPLLAQEVF